MHSVSLKKSDPGYVLVPAHILRTDLHAHRPLPDGGELGRAIAVLARAQQDATWNRQQNSNQLCSLLRDYYPAAPAVNGASPPRRTASVGSSGPGAHHSPLVEEALGKQMLALPVHLEAPCTAADVLAGAVEESFPQYPDAELSLSFPGLGVQLGARVLAEIGYDRNRFADARGLKAYAGSSPITRASGKKASVSRR